MRMNIEQSYQIHFHNLSTPNRTSLRAWLTLAFFHFCTVWNGISRNKPPTIPLFLLFCFFRSFCVPLLSAVPVREFSHFNSYKLHYYFSFSLSLLYFTFTFSGYYLTSPKITYEEHVKLKE